MIVTRRLATTSRLLFAVRSRFKKILLYQRKRAITLSRFGDVIAQRRSRFFSGVPIVVFKNRRNLQKERIYTLHTPIDDFVDEKKKIVYRSISIQVFRFIAQCNRY